MKVLGVDPGTLATGWSVVERDARGVLRALDYGIIRTKAASPLWDRLEVIHAKIQSVAMEHRPDALALETCFVSKNVQSALKLGHTRGAIMVAGKTGGAEIFEYAPTEIKSAVTGYGRADKHQVAEMVRVILNLPVAAPSDASDALAAAICHIHGHAYRRMAAQTKGVRR